MLEHSPAEIFRQLLIDLQLGAEPDVSNGKDWPVYTGQEPDAPDECITVYDTTWRVDGRAMHNGETFWHYGVQLRARSRTQYGGWTKTRTIQETLDQKVVGV